MTARSVFTLCLVIVAATIGCTGQTIPPEIADASSPGMADASIAPAGLPVPAPALPLVRTTVRVSATEDVTETLHSSPPPFHAIAEDILPSAGTYGDFTRYLQVSPGVVGNGDYSDDLIVRGGNPIENLFLVDGFEVPNINQITIEGTSGGISTMIDTAAIDGVDLYTGGYDPSYEGRLSSVVDIRTRSAAGRERHGEFEAGYVGAGGLLVAPLGHNGSILGSAHQSFLNLFDSNVGIGGTPIYNNMLWTGQIRPTEADEFNFLSLSGFDTLDLKPGVPGNCAGTSQINMGYTGWRSTNGLRWHHIFSARSVGVLTASDSEDQENIQQEDSLFDVSLTGQAARQQAPVLIYSQVSHDSRSNLKYDFTFDNGRQLFLIAGAAGYLDHVNYQIAQPEGEPSPLSANPTATNADSFAPNFLSGASGSYAELTWRPLPWWNLSGGGRVQTFALGGRWTATPHLNMGIKLSQHTGLHAAFGEYAQMPPTVDMTAWPQNHFLLPIRARHLEAGADLYTGSHAKIGVEAYQKNYRDYPVSTQYPSLSLANMVDDLGQAILWLPLVSEGTGVARGIELSTAGHMGTRITGLINVAYGHTEYAGADKVLRPGNYDYPLVGNSTGTYRTPKHYEMSWHYTYTSGKPYTPFLLQQSMEQNRPIYDLSKINAVRGPVYSRMDFETDRSFFIGSRRLVAYVGVQNAWNHKDFLGYFWMAREDAYWDCQHNASNCMTEVDSLPRIPDGGIRFTF